MTTTSEAPTGFQRELGPGGLETRTVANQHGRVEARAADDGPGLIGYGSVFDTPFRIGGYFSEWDEEVAPGAFKDAIRTGDVRSMFNHDTNWLLGRQSSGSLRLSEDDVGLKYEVDINREDPNAMSVHARVDRGDVDGSSIWFRVAKQEWTYPSKSNDLEVPKRRILLVDPLYETGPVVFPANEAAGVSARSGQILDQVLRSAGVKDEAARAGLAERLLADPGAVEQELRGLFTDHPEIRDAACGCSTDAAGIDLERLDAALRSGALPVAQLRETLERAEAALARADDVDARGAGMPAEDERRLAAAKGLSAWTGLPMTDKE